MNVLPVSVDGTVARLGGEAIDLPGAPAPAGGAKVELGIRPEYVALAREGLPFSLTRVDDVGREKIVHGTVGGHAVSAILGEDEEIPAEPRAVFRPEGINLYADSWRIETRR
jgi:glycerol transport system ATP-binding protein